MTFKPSIYGLMVGLAVLIVWQLSEIRTKRIGFKHSLFLQSSLVFGCGALVGARVWHVLTDLPDYLVDWQRVFAVWQGGLSVWGALWGGVVGLGVFVYFSRSKLSGAQRWDEYWRFLDVLSVSLPIAQAIGRLGNWFNQELYGLPSNLPWAIYIDPQHRLPDFANVEWYHPLFLYEMIGLMIIWALGRRLPPQRPPGRRFVLYLLLYTFLRFLLDFIRLDQLMLPFGNLSVNQVASVSLLLLFISTRKLLYK